jgi:predicted nucleic acid-binding Zn ribbon protein
MSLPPPPPEVQPRAGRPAVVGSGRACAVCHGPLEGRKRDACSDPCRRALNRQRGQEELLALVDRVEADQQRAAEALQALRRKVEQA